MTKETLASELHDLLELPKGKHFNMRAGKGYKIVGAILQSMSEALSRGESVSIAGFGIFKIVTRQATNCFVCYFHGNRRLNNRQVILLQQKKYIKFQPAKPLLKLINDKV